MTTNSRYSVVFHTDTSCDTSGVEYDNLQEAIDYIDLYITDKTVSYFYDYAGGVVVVYDEETSENVYVRDIPEAHTGRAERYAYYYDADARAHAEYLMPKGGYIEDDQADADTLPCPRELESWDGEIGAYRVYDAWGNEVAIVGYWD